jgi:hypothetical protein
MESWVSFVLSTPWPFLLISHHNSSLLSFTSGNQLRLPSRCVSELHNLLLSYNFSPSPLSSALQSFTICFPPTNTNTNTRHEKSFMLNMVMLRNHAKHNHKNITKWDFKWQRLTFSSLTLPVGIFFVFVDWELWQMRLNFARWLYQRFEHKLWFERNEKSLNLFWRKLCAKFRKWNQNSHEHVCVE